MRATSALAAPDDRRGWALAAHFLGDPKPFAAFAEDFRAGRLPYPPGQDGKEGWLEAAVAALSRADTPEASRALDALAEPEHPAHAAIVRLILGRSTVLAYENNLWFRHPYCLRILRRLLDDKAPTGLTQVLDGESFVRRPIRTSCPASSRWAAPPPRPTWSREKRSFISTARPGRWT